MSDTDAQLLLGDGQDQPLLFTEPAPAPAASPSTPAGPEPQAAESKLGLAVRYRPRSFADLVGQRHVVAVLRQAVRSGNPPRQVLFSGGSGLGKTTVARIFAAALNCERPIDGDACGECDSCLDVTFPGRSHPDVIELDAASNGGKDEVNSIASRAALAPMRSRFKVYIIDEAHGLSRPGAEAFLKLLEEPPPHVIFLLATTDPQKMLATNRGRCLQLELAEPTESELVGNVLRIARAEEWQLPEWVATEVVRSTDHRLGVRGTVMSLAKLEPLLSSGSAPTAEEVAALLGSVPTERAALLLGSIDHHRPEEALEHLAELRRFHGDGEIRAVLVAWVRDRVRASADLLAVWRLEQVAAAPTGALWTEVLVVKLASPALAASSDALAAVVEQAERAGVRLEQLLERAVTSGPSDLGTPSFAAPAVHPAAGAAREPGPLDEPHRGIVPVGVSEGSAGVGQDAIADVDGLDDTGQDQVQESSSDVSGDVSRDVSEDRFHPHGVTPAPEPHRSSAVPTSTFEDSYPVDEPEWLDALLDGTLDDAENFADSPPRRSAGPVTPAPTGTRQGAASGPSTGKSATRPQVSPSGKPSSGRTPSAKPSPASRSVDKAGNTKQPAGGARPAAATPTPTTQPATRPPAMGAGVSAGDNDPWFDNPDAYETRPAEPATPVALTVEDVLAAVRALSPKAATVLSSCQLRTGDGKLIILVPPDLAERIRHSNLSALVRSAVPGTAVQFLRFA